jgi:hypothetical protein
VLSYKPILHGRLKKSLSHILLYAGKSNEA